MVAELGDDPFVVATLDGDLSAHSSMGGRIK